MVMEVPVIKKQSPLAVEEAIQSDVIYTAVLLGSAGLINQTTFSRAHIERARMHLTGW